MTLWAGALLAIGALLIFLGWKWTSPLQAIARMPVITEDVEKIGRALLNTSVMKHYAVHSEEIVSYLLSRKPDILKGLGESKRQYEKTQHEANRYAKIYDRRCREKLPFDTFLSGVLASVGVGLGIATITEVSLFGTVLSETGLPFLAFALGVFPALLVKRLTNSGSKTQDLLSRKDSADRARLNYAEKLRTAVQECLSKAINEQLGPKGILHFPTVAPRLVELDSSIMVPSDNLRRIDDFMSNHESSAIGLAGSRGAGKSTIMRALISAIDSGHDGLSLYISAPVVFDQGDFSRRLLHQLASKIAGPHPPRRRPARRTIFMRMMVGYFIILTGLFLTTYDQVMALGSRFFTVVPVNERFLFGFSLLVLGLVVFWYNLLSSEWFAWRRHARKPHIRELAAGILDRLEWEIELGATTKNVGKIPGGGLFELHDEDSVKKKHRVLSHADVVTETRKLLEEYCRDHQSSAAKLLVCIDELDKLESPEALMATINSLKDLFHVRGAHFLVAVSTDALHSFERRGLPHRNVFDSAFDTVIPVGRLAVMDSVDIVASRAEGFPPVLSMFCHAWSGGLARDLLRSARACVELQRRHEHALPVIEIVTRMITDDLLTLVLGLVDAACIADQRNLLEMVNLVEAVRHGNGTYEELIELAETSFEDDPQSTLDAARTRVCVGICIIRLALWWSSKAKLSAKPKAESWLVREDLLTVVSKAANTLAHGIEFAGAGRSLRDRKLSECLAIHPVRSYGRP